MKHNTICLWFGKGGCGKSLSTYAISSYLSRKFSTLAVDLDSQATLSSALIEELPEHSTYDWLSKTHEFDEVVVPAAPAFPEKLQLAPATSNLAKAETETAANLDRHFLLADVLSDSDFQFRVIDTPPNSGICTIAALVAASHVICPVSTEPAAWEQMAAFEALLAQVKRRMNPHLEWLGILPTRFDGRNNLDNEVLKALKEKYGSLCFSPVRSSVRWREVMVSLGPPWHQQSTDYLTITNEILARLNHEKIISPSNCRQ